MFSGSWTVINDASRGDGGVSLGHGATSSSAPRVVRACEDLRPFSDEAPANELNERRCRILSCLFPVLAPLASHLGLCFSFHFLFVLTEPRSKFVTNVWSRRKRKGDAVDGASKKLKAEDDAEQKKLEEELKVLLSGLVLRP